MNVLHIVIISDINFDPYFYPLIKARFGESAKVYLIHYGEQNEDERRKQLEESEIIVVWLNLESTYSHACDALYSQPISHQQIIEEVVASCKRLYSDIIEYTNALIIWFLFEDYFNKWFIATGHTYNAIVDRINAELNDKLKNDVSLIDLKRLIAEVGISNAYDLKGKYRWNAPYSKVLIESAIKEIHKQYLIAQGTTKKCLVLDCDNVLWGGILSEDGIENIKLGGAGLGWPYQDFQRFALALYYHGIILAICSKNDLSDVITMFREHSEMVLKEEHIACFQVNWENKPDNIKRITESLNISLDSMVFIDDSPVEIEAVKSMLPEVTAIRHDRDISYEEFSCFNLKSNVSMTDIEKRNETYRTNQFRETLKAQYDSYSEYIAALEIKADIHEALPIEYSRIAELTQRTNKCTNGKRYTVSEVKERISCKNTKLYTLSVSDRFSDLGLVGAFEIEGSTLNLFSLSCRVLGREIEGRLLHFIADKYRVLNIKFKSTGKNEDVKDILIQEFPNATLINCENS